MKRSILLLMVGWLLVFGALIGLVLGVVNDVPAVSWISALVVLSGSLVIGWSLPRKRQESKAARDRS